MFSTMLTVMDGFPRAISRAYHTLRVGLDNAYEEEKEKPYWIALVALALLTLAVFHFFAGSLTTMVDFATIVSFTTAPVLGYLNLRAVSAGHVPARFRPGRVLLSVLIPGTISPDRHGSRLCAVLHIELAPGSAQGSCDVQTTLF